MSRTDPLTEASAIIELALALADLPPELQAQFVLIEAERVTAIRSAALRELGRPPRVWREAAFAVDEIRVIGDDYAPVPVGRKRGGGGDR